MLSRIDILSLTLDEIKPDIVALCEHKMSEVEISGLNISNYKVCSSFSRSLTTGGGVIILSRNNVNCKNLNIKSVQSLITEKEFECCIAIVKADNISFVIACVYRSPQFKYEEPFLNKIDILIGTLLKKNKNICIVGDLNINVLNCNSTYLRFCNILKSHGLTYMIDFPTRISDTTATAIDNCLTNLNKNKIRAYGINTEISDHDGQVLEILNTVTSSWSQVQTK